MPESRFLPTVTRFETRHMQRFFSRRRSRTPTFLPSTNTCAQSCASSTVNRVTPSPIAAGKVDIPKDINTNRVHPHRFTHPDAMFPIFMRNSCIMNLCRFYRERLAVQQKLHQYVRSSTTFLFLTAVSTLPAKQRANKSLHRVTPALSPKTTHK